MGPWVRSRSTIRGRHLEVKIEHDAAGALREPCGASHDRPVGRARSASGRPRAGGCRRRGARCSVSASRTLSWVSGVTREPFERKGAESARGARGLPVQGPSGRRALRRQGQEPQPPGPQLPDRRLRGPAAARADGPGHRPRLHPHRQRGRSAAARVVARPPAQAPLQRDAQGRQELPVRPGERRGRVAADLDHPPGQARRLAVSRPVHRRQGPAAHAARDPPHLSGADLPELRGLPPRRPALPLLPHQALRRAVLSPRRGRSRRVPRDDRRAPALPERPRRRADPATARRDGGVVGAPRVRARGGAPRPDRAARERAGAPEGGCARRARHRRARRGASRAACRGGGADPARRQGGRQADAPDRPGGRARRCRCAARVPEPALPGRRGCAALPGDGDRAAGSGSDGRGARASSGARGRDPDPAARPRPPARAHCRAQRGARARGSRGARGGASCALLARDARPAARARAAGAAAPHGVLRRLEPRRRGRRGRGGRERERRAAEVALPSHSHPPAGPGRLRDDPRGGRALLDAGRVRRAAAARPGRGRRWDRPGARRAHGPRSHQHRAGAADRARQARGGDRARERAAAPAPAPQPVAQGTPAPARRGPSLRALVPPPAAQPLALRERARPGARRRPGAPSGAAQGVRLGRAIGAASAEDIARRANVPIGLASRVAAHLASRPLGHSSAGFEPGRGA